VTAPTDTARTVDTKAIARLLHELSELATGAKAVANGVPSLIVQRSRPFASHARRIVADLEKLLEVPT